MAKLIADEVPFKHRADIIRIGEDMGEGRMIAGAHYPTDTNFGHLLADELYRLAKEPKKSELTLEILDFELTEGRIFDKIKGGIVKIKAVWSQLKRYISGAFRKVKNLLPFQTVVFTIPGLAKEEIDFMSLEKTKDGKVTLNENSSS